MKKIIHQQAGKQAVEILAETCVFQTPQEALELLLNLSYELNVAKVILHQKNIIPEFFDLRTRLAGEVFQKVVNYRMQVAIVGAFDSFQSESLRAFISECNRGSQICFAIDLASAKEFLFSKEI